MPRSRYRKVDLNEFVKWVWGAHAKPSGRLVGLYQRALICQAFPAYKLHELKAAPAVELLQALELLETARKAQS